MQNAAYMRPYTDQLPTIKSTKLSFELFFPISALFGILLIIRYEMNSDKASWP